ncbi:MAG: hypothetical protein ABH888_00930, partial [Patescibacteria group bacterium]
MLKYFNKIFFYLYFIIAIISAVVLTLILLFLYKNCYQIIIQSEEIIILRSGVFIENININKFNEVI